MRWEKGCLLIGGEGELEQHRVVSGWLACLTAASYGFRRLSHHRQHRRTRINLKLRFCFSITQVTETRTGPLGCSNYDNLDSVSSVLVQSPENKVQLQGLSGFNGFLRLFTALLICLIATWAKKSIKIFFFSFFFLFNQAISSARAFLPLHFHQRSPGLMTALKPCCFYRSAADPPRLPEGRLCTGCPQLHRL